MSTWLYNSIWLTLISILILFKLLGCDKTSYQYDFKEPGKKYSKPFLYRFLFIHTDNMGFTKLYSSKKDLQVYIKDTKKQGIL